MKIPLKIIILPLLCIVLHGITAYGEETGGKAAQNTSVSKAALYPFSQKGNFELGGVAGMPSGINARWWIADIFGIDFTLGSTIRTGHRFYP